jgi:hypothetical protein
MKMVRFGIMKKLSETYKELGIAFTFPIEIKDENGNRTYYEDSDGYWSRHEYDENGKQTYYEDRYGYWERCEYGKKGNKTYSENSNGLWWRYEYDENGNLTYFENCYGDKRGTKRGSCDGKVVEVDGKKYKLTEL